MHGQFRNVYQDTARAESYAKLEFPGSYYLAYRDLPQIMAEHVKGKRALDFGCGAGRSSRFLKSLGFETVGLDISPDMLKLARARDPGGDYRLLSGDSLEGLPVESFDLALSAFTFDNIPTLEKKVRLFSELKKLLAPEGKIINLGSSPDIYIHEWTSFTTKDFPENRKAKSGDRVKIIMKDVEDRRPVEDILWADDAYRKVYELAGLETILMHKPLATTDEPYEWVNETKIAPWVIYVLKKRGA